MLTLKKKEKIIKEHKKHGTDTGSPEVQIGLLSNQIKELLSHLKKHPKDLHSKKGLLKMVSRRRKFLKFLKDKSARRYNAIIKKVGLKR